MPWTCIVLVVETNKVVRRLAKRSFDVLEAPSRTRGARQGGYARRFGPYWCDWQPWYIRSLARRDQPLLEPVTPLGTRDRGGSEG